MSELIITLTNRDEITYRIASSVDYWIDGEFVTVVLKRGQYGNPTSIRHHSVATVAHIAYDEVPA